MALCQVSLLITGFTHSHSIPSASMQPTMVAGDAIELPTRRLNGIGFRHRK
jgi:hypothetical protein